MIRCLVVDDDKDIRESLGEYLTGFGMTVATAANGARMRMLMESGAWDVVVLDIMLPDGSGLDFCRWIHQNSDSAVIMLTAQRDAGSRILGLEIGADDYLGKPFEPRELVARINAVCRRIQKGQREPDQPRTRAVFHRWTFDRLRHQLVSPDGVTVAMSSAEYRLLSAFVDNPGRVLSRDQLIEKTRAGGVEVNDRSIDLAVSRLRQKLGDSPRDGRLIKTLRGEGYLFDAQVES